MVLDKPGPPNSLQSEEGHVPGPTEFPALVPGQNWVCFRDQRWGAGVSANQEAELNSSTDDYGPATGDFSTWMLKSTSILTMGWSSELTGWFRDKVLAHSLAVSTCPPAPGIGYARDRVVGRTHAFWGVRAVFIL